MFANTTAEEPLNKISLLVLMPLGDVAFFSLKIFKIKWQTFDQPGRCAGVKTPSLRVTFVE